MNLQHQYLTSCDGDCFDDLCLNCRTEIMSSDNETEYDSTNDLRLLSSPPAKLIDYSTDDETDIEPNSVRSTVAAIQQDKFDQLNEELNRKSQQVSRHIESIHTQFQEICDGLNYQDQILVQLFRQHNHCTELLSTFEDFLVSFEEETDSFIYCGNWFAQILLLKERFNRFDRNGEILIQHLNNKMEMLYDEFNDNKRQLVANQTLSNLNQVSLELRFINTRISAAEVELDDIIDYIAVQIQEQRDLIGRFVEIMTAICRAVESTIVCNDVSEFDCFNGQHFLQEYHRTLSSIQII